jgi:hypothetical protein
VRFPDSRRSITHFSFVPGADIGVLFDHFVGAGEERSRYLNAERLGRLQIDDELPPTRLIDRHVGGFCAFQNLIDLHRGVQAHICVVNCVCEESSQIDKGTIRVDRRKSILSYLLDD